jgi:uncharacterized membrane-anchored protein
MVQHRNNSKPPIPPAKSSSEAATRTPLWETLAMIAAFVLLWLWFGARSSALKANVDLDKSWTAALLVALAAMAFITVRRVQRFKRALEESSAQTQRGPAMPWMPPDRNSRN